MSTVTKQFYLVGDDPSTARLVEVDGSQALKSLQEILGDEFHIIQPSGKKTPNTLLYMFAVDTRALKDNN